MGALIAVTFAVTFALMADGAQPGLPPAGHSCDVASLGLNVFRTSVWDRSDLYRLKRGEVQFFRRDTGAAVRNSRQLQAGMDLMIKPAPRTSGMSVCIGNPPSLHTKLTVPDPDADGVAETDEGELWRYFHVYQLETPPPGVLWISVDHSHTGHAFLAPMNGDDLSNPRLDGRQLVADWCTPVFCPTDTLSLRASAEPRPENSGDDPTATLLCAILRSLILHTSCADDAIIADELCSKIENSGYASLASIAFEDCEIVKAVQLLRTFVGFSPTGSEAQAASSLADMLTL